MEIRELHRSELNELADLIGGWVPGKAANFRAGQVPSGRYQNLVAVSESRLVGWLEGMHDSGLWNAFHGLPDELSGPRCSFIDFLYVRPDWRRERVVGPTLLAVFEDEAQRRGNGFVCTNPQPGEAEQRVQAFYREQGYSLAGHAAGQLHYLMGKHLDSPE